MPDTKLGTGLKALIRESLIFCQHVIQKIVT